MVYEYSRDAIRCFEKFISVGLVFERVSSTWSERKHLKNIGENHQKSTKVN